MPTPQIEHDLQIVEHDPESFERNRQIADNAPKTVEHNYPFVEHECTIVEHEYGNHALRNISGQLISTQRLLQTI